jgi:two-component system NtrC family sensor kinase
MRLALKVVLATVLGTMAVLLIFGYMRTRREIALFDVDMRNDHALIGTTLAVCVATTWGTAGPERAIDLVSQADADRQGLTITWIYPEGHLQSARFPAHFPLLQDGRSTDGITDHVIEPEGGSGPRLLVTHVPVHDKGQLVGAIEIAESLASRDSFVSASVWSTGLATGSMVLVSGLVVLVFGVLIVGRPMRQLTEKAKQIGRGDLSGRLDLRQRDEIGELALEVNAMCERLIEARSETEKEAAARIAAHEQLRHADRLITVGRLAAGVAHELGTPLNVIAGRTKMLRRGAVEVVQREEYLGIIAEEVTLMTTIIRQLMDFARRREPKMGLADLTAAARSIQRLMSPIAAKRQVQIVVTSEEPVVAFGDRAQLEQVMSNLVANAVHACPVGGRVEITAGRREDEEQAYFRVTDDGHGMDDATRQRIFEPFFTTKEVGQGTGLGLSVAHGIVTEHGGSISVQSQPNHGSSFSVFLRGATA